MRPTQLLLGVQAALDSLAAFFWDECYDDGSDWETVKALSNTLASYASTWRACEAFPQVDEGEYYLDAALELQEAQAFIQDALGDVRTAAEVWQRVESGRTQGFSSLQNLAHRLARVVLFYWLRSAEETLSSWGSASRWLLRRIKQQLHTLASDRPFRKRSLKSLQSAVNGACDALHRLADQIRDGEIQVEDSPELLFVDSGLAEETDLSVLPGSEFAFTPYEPWTPGNDDEEVADDEEDVSEPEEDAEEPPDERLPDPEELDDQADDLEEAIEAFLPLAAATT
jgi:hypothetical protein